MKCYTEALAHELRNTAHNNLRTALLVPGWVNTNIQRNYVRQQAAQKGRPLQESDVFFDEDTKPAAGAWMPAQVIDFMMAALDDDRFYIICPDHDVDRDTDNARMTWTMQDITHNRVPLSRWHPDYQDAFAQFLASETKK